MSDFVVGDRNTEEKHSLKSVALSFAYTLQKLRRTLFHDARGLLVVKDSFIVTPEKFRINNGTFNFTQIFLVFLSNQAVSLSRNGP